MTALTCGRMEVYPSRSRADVCLKIAFCQMDRPLSRRLSSDTSDMLQETAGTNKEKEKRL